MSLSAKVLDEGACYFAPTAQAIAMNLLRSAHCLFFAASAIRHLDKLLCLFPEDWVLNNQTHKAIWELTDSLLDRVCIVTALENVSKAKLIVQGFVVHKVNRDTQPDIAKRQKKQPIPIADIYSAEAISAPSTNEFSFSSLLPQTLEAYVLFGKPDYQACTGWDVHTFDIINTLAAERNRLHFHPGSAWPTGHKLFAKYDRLRELFRNDVRAQHNQLVRQQGLPSDFLLTSI